MCVDCRVIIVSIIIGIFSIAIAKHQLELPTNAMTHSSELIQISLECGLSWRRQKKRFFLFLVRSLSVLISIILQWRNLRAIREIQKVDRSSPWIVGNSTTSYFETPTRWPKMGSPNARYQNLEIGLRSKWSWRVSQIFPCVQFSLWLNNDEPTHFAIDFHSHSLVSLPITFIKVTRYRWTKCRHKKAKSSP